MAIKDHIELIAPRYHNAIEDWQNKNFPDINLLKKYWHKHFPNEEYQLCARTNTIKNELIIQGKHAGHKKFARAREMKGSMLYQALRIIKAQCSTELGSIQQHADTVDSSVSDYAKFSVLRIMAEELRHAYQMFWVLSHDPTWASTGDKKISNNIMEELLSMGTGSHVLDAFNIEFTDSLDNITFAALIDRVGKFQLSMQEEFAYSPMSASMKPMLREEAFHLKTGWTVLKEICEQAALGEGKWTLDDVQRKINVWYPRALEMFGSEEGGESNIQFCFKTSTNKEAIEGYINEVEWLMSSFNTAIHKARDPSLSKEALRKLSQEDRVLTLPSAKFLRIRSGELIQDSTYDLEGKKIKLEKYLDYLKTVLPEKFMGTKFFTDYASRFNQLKAA